MSKRRPRGRRPGPSGTREAIEVAARREFSEYGYDRATMRSIAAEAGVDVSLVAHFFGTKQGLFVSVMAMPFDPGQVLPEVLAGPRSGSGRRLATFLLETLENPQARAVLTGILRAAASEPEAARMARELVAQRIVTSIAESLGAADAPVRANLVASQTVGLIMARYILRLEPLASLSPDSVVDAIAPNLQRYLTGEITAP